MDETARLLTEVRDLQRQLLEAQKEASDLDLRGLKTLMTLLFPLTSGVILYILYIAASVIHR